MLRQTLFGIVLSVPLSACAQSTLATSEAQKKAMHDLTAFANATCLAKQKEDQLKESGFAWANAIVQKNMTFTLENIILPLNEAIDKALSNTPMYMVSDERMPMQGQALPIAHCFEISQQAEIQVLIQDLSKMLR
ncbi:MAG: hypothetical protein Q4G44_11070 [Alcaligenaceae bacterium]|nr:hypothetical protein [Alcaligenaceae bacterium]